MFEALHNRVTLFVKRAVLWSRWHFRPWQVSPIKFNLLLFCNLACTLQLATVLHHQLLFVLGVMILRLYLSRLAVGRSGVNEGGIRTITLN